MSLTDLLQMETITTREGLEELREEWSAATEASLVPNVFLSWEWVTTWWEHFGRPGQLRVLVFRDSEGVAAIAPLQVCEIGVGPVRARVLERVNPEAGDYGGVIVVRRPGDVAEKLFEMLTDELRSGRVEAAMLSRFASDDSFLEHWRDTNSRHARSFTTEEARLEGGCYFTDVREDFKLSKHTKKHKIRQRLRRISEAHETVDFTYHSGDDLEEGLELLLEVHRQRWADREGELQGLLAEPDREAFMLDVIRALDSGGLVRLLTLRADGRPVAAELDFVLGDRVFMFKGAFDPEFSPYSPGQLLHHRVFEDGMEEGINIFDFGRGDQAYKQRWANGERHLLSTTTFRAGWRGRLANLRLRACRGLEVRRR